MVSAVLLQRVRVREMLLLVAYDSGGDRDRGVDPSFVVVAPVLDILHDVRHRQPLLTADGRRQIRRQITHSIKIVTKLFVQRLFVQRLPELSFALPCSLAPLFYLGDKTPIRHGEAWL